MIYGKWTECMYSVEPRVYESHRKSDKKTEKKVKGMSDFRTKPPEMKCCLELVLTFVVEMFQLSNVE